MMIRGAVWCVALLMTVNAFPNGAPKSACKSLKPSHGLISAQKDKSPYVLEVSKQQVKSLKSDDNGDLQTITVTLKGDDENKFRGFVLQARGEGDDIGIGTFTADKSGKVLECSDSKGTVTHTNRDEKSSVSFKWSPPLDYEGKVSFSATAVQGFRTFWTTIKSVPVAVTLA